MDQSERSQTDEETETEQSDSSSDEELENNPSKKVRGPTRLGDLFVKTNDGKKFTIEFDVTDQVIGPNRPILASFIGTEARRKLGLRYLRWKEVPPTERDMFWQNLTRMFEFEKTVRRRKKLLSKFNALWRRWRRDVAKYYIIPFENRPRILKKVPKVLQTLVDKEDWDKFVNWRLSGDAKELSKRALKGCAENKYPHRLGRLGYAGLKEKVEKKKKENKDPDEPISPTSRATLWKLARQDDNGQYLNEDISSKAEEIDECTRKIDDGSLTCDVDEDALTHALGAEHPGRVRAAGGGVTKNQYFDIARHPRSSAKAYESRITQLEEKLKEKDMEKQMLEEKLQKEMDRRLQARTIELEKDMHKKMEAMMRGMMSQNNSQGAIQTNSATSGKRVAQSSIGSRRQPTPRQSDVPCKLLDSKYNIVAFGHVCHSNGNEEVTVHGLPLAKDCERVAINSVEIGKSLLPRPSGEHLTVQDALGSFVAWPKELVLPISDETTCPDEFQQFFAKARHVLNDDKVVQIEVDVDLFQSETEIPLSLRLEDIEFVCNCQDLTGVAILIYIKLLFGKMEIDERQTRFGFLKPSVYKSYSFKGSGHSGSKRETGKCKTEIRFYTLQYRKPLDVDGIF